MLGYNTTDYTNNDRFNKNKEHSFAYVGSEMALKDGGVKDNRSLQGRSRFQCSHVDFPVECQHNVEPRSIVNSHSQVLNATFKVEVGEAGLIAESAVG